MKKLFSLLLVFMMVIGLGACASSQEPYNDDDLLKQIEELQKQIDEFENYDDTNILNNIEQLNLRLVNLQGRYSDQEIDDINAEIYQDIIQLEHDINTVIQTLESLSITVGLNGQTEIYQNTDKILQKMSTSIEVMKDTFDKSKAPSYIVDDNGDYVSLYTLSQRLKLKYFETDNVMGEELYEMGEQLYIRLMFNSELSDDEIIARALLLIEELRLYEFYMLSCPKFVLHIYKFDDYDHQIKIEIPLVVMLNDYFKITPDGIYDGDYEMNLTAQGLNISLETIQTYYDDFVLNETFSGFVLNWE